MEALLFLLPAFTACLVLVGIHTYLGIHVITRGIIFLDIALAQIAAVGLTFAFLLGFHPDGSIAYATALGFTFLAAVLFSLIRNLKVSLEAIIGITFVVASAVSILLADRIPHGVEHLKHILSGNILWVTGPQILKTAIIYSVLGLFHFIFRNKFLMASNELASAHQNNSRIWLWDFLFYVTFGIVITSSVQIAGILLVFSFLIMPALCCMLFFTDMKKRILLGWALGLFASIVGITASWFLDIPTGPSIVAVLGIAVILSFIIRHFSDKGAGFE
jgi:zinc/manganese transport system permease protein